MCSVCGFFLGVWMNVELGKIEKGGIRNGVCEYSLRDRGVCHWPPNWTHSGFFLVCVLQA